MRRPYCSAGSVYADSWFGSAWHCLRTVFLVDHGGTFGGSVMTGGRFSVALAERNLGGRIVGASHWWRYDGRHDGYLGGVRWFDSERDAVLALVGSGFDPARWAVWFFPADLSVPLCRGSVADLWAGDVSAGR